MRSILTFIFFIFSSGVFAVDENSFKSGVDPATAREILYIDKGLYTGDFVAYEESFLLYKVKDGGELGRNITGVRILDIVNKHSYFIYPWDFKGMTTENPFGNGPKIKSVNRIVNKFKIELVGSKSYIIFDLGNKSFDFSNL
ncbi:hypothetical protein [Pleionea litopenaei]|uniref:Uncharacterized protein n=1 Tax=Pleionea litopenaei TaxID=3070815 RepID=A0AA51RS60_9GAMM|nr:hypothetical protein [Pleionea sp. HL-JVS1]WMS86582.1 hypothetical protein Q9312_15280 [Pleionea sp. HL-JVS1]